MRQKPQQQDHNTRASQFIFNNMYKMRKMTIEDQKFNPWDLQRSLANNHPGNLYEVKNTSDGDVVSINDGECTVFCGDSAFSIRAQKAIKIDNYINDYGSGGGRGSLLSILVIALIILALILLW